MNLTPTPPIPSGRLSGQRFFRVNDRDFHYVSDEPIAGYSGSRPSAWLNALNYAAETHASSVSEMTTERLNDYVGSGIFGPARTVAHHDTGE